MPLGQFQDIHRTDPEGRVNPRFRHHLIRFRHFIDGSLALASLNRACRDHRPDVSAALTTVAFDQSGPRWLGISNLIAEPEGPTFISYKVARSRLDRLRFVTQDPSRTSRRVYFSCAHLCGTQRPPGSRWCSSLVRTMRLPSYMLTVKH